MLLRCMPTRLLTMALLAFCLTTVQAKNIEFAIMPGSVIEAHADLEEQCEKCHVRFNPGAQPQLCLDCHEAVAEDVKTKQGYHGRLEDTNCRDCHTDHKGRDARIVELDEISFDHAQTDFQLIGKHEKASCESCHEAGILYRKTPSACIACHRKEDEHKGSFGERCESCHRETDWKQLTFHHDTDTDFRLVGRHRDTPCTDCHTGPLHEQETPGRCHDCHSKDDAHKRGLGKKCETCHTAKSWKDINFNHHTDTGFKLRHKHASAQCDSCHLPGRNPAKTSANCYSCHAEDDRKKGHKGRYGKKCNSCHNEKAFKPSTFKHDRDTRYPLRYKHKNVKCDSCHKGKSIHDKLDTACVTCHETDDMDKGHKGRYGNKCETCHVEKSFKTIIFEHDRDTEYPLTGRHRKAKCDNCHEEPIGLVEMDTRCYACHKTDDIHFGTYDLRCDKCHINEDWRKVKERDDVR
jgi:hypothetical protein